MQEVLSGPHTRVRVDAAVMPSAPPLVSPQGKSKKKAAPMRQMGLGSFYKGLPRPAPNTPATTQAPGIIKDAMAVIERFSQKWVACNASDVDRPVSCFLQGR